MIQSDVIRLAIREELPNDTTLKTSSGAEFLVESISPTQVVFRVGEKRNRVTLDLACIEDLVKEFKFLPPGRWMRIGASRGKPKPGTLDAAVQPHSRGGSATSYFAAVLQHIGVAEINPDRPARIRLTI